MTTTAHRIGFAAALAAVVAGFIGFGWRRAEGAAHDAGGDGRRRDSMAMETQQAETPYALIRITPGRPNVLATMTSDESQVIERHFQYLVGLRDKGVVVHAGRTTDPARLWGIVLMKTTVVEAEALMTADPAVKAGLQKVEVFPYRIAIDRP